MLMFGYARSYGLNRKFKFPAKSTINIEVLYLHFLIAHAGSFP
jgi:hypothetical protein